ncbi:Galactose-1-phosphate uridylyltransferase [Rubripirellula lacrimiformis]|uniref:Galactose-1-phosphate uridylyltransferase n=1 Tax=Rubripirellula lacrimiformis TaxID=1930273 RepID=A0A517N577_9BACT|nr:DUF4921 family protein [Rubripirellula lacrimiformis]QDT02287.1 Galactose-1-phosphate uridylyltransferase [Rubripirellula lacrimiformis]
MDIIKQSDLVKPSANAKRQAAASETRLDPFSGQWSIFAPQRTERPDEFVEHRPTIKTDVACPFCRGNESETPPAVWSKHIPETARLFSADDGPADYEDWSVRVVPNKFPAVDSIDETSTAPSTRPSALFQSNAVTGGHEVIVESPRHFHSLTELDIAEIDLIFQAYRDRIRHYRNVAGVQYVSVFKNVGRTAGASLSHSHSQLIATDRIPQPVASVVENMGRHRANTGCCLRCDVVRAERKAKERVVACDETVIATCPFASQLPMLVRVTTLKHQACFEDLGDRELESVSRMVYRVITWLEQLRPGTAYNYCLHTKPPGIVDPSDSFHWYIDIFPRMSQVAGFEWGSGCMINPILPEEAAASLRKCSASRNPRRF